MNISDEIREILPKISSDKSVPEEFDSLVDRLGVPDSWFGKVITAESAIEFFEMKLKELECPK